MQQELRFGLIGAGQIAWPSAKSINSHPGATVAAAQDLNPERLQKLCEANAIKAAYAASEELLADPDIDAVYIAVPNKFHAPLAKAALEAGKHVILEKPFAFNHNEAVEVVEAAEKAGRVFTVGMNQRFNPDSLKVYQLAREGLFGEMYHAKAYWFRRSGIPKLGTWFGKKELSGGGCLYDIGVHLLDLCLFIIGNFEPVSVTGATYTKFGNRGLGEGSWGHSEREHPEFDVDDFASALIRFRNGATVSLDVSWACHAEEVNRNNVQIYGTEAGATCYPSKLFKYGEKDGEYQVVEGPEAELPYSPDRFHNFINHILGKEDLCVSTAEALVVQRILDAIEESSATGREVRLD